MRWALVLLLAAGCLAPPASGVVLTDDLGVPVEVGRLERIVVTSTDLAEVFVALGHGHRLAAIPAWVESTTSCVRAPPGLEGIPRIGRPHVILAEDVIAIGPSLVIEKDHPLQPTRLAVPLRQAGVPTYYVDNAETLENVRHTIDVVARILATVDPGVQSRARNLTAAFDAEIDAVRTALKNRTDPTPRVLFQFPSAIVAGNGTSAHLLLQIVGGTNVAGALRGYKQMSSEAVAASDPERIVLSCTAGGTPRSVFGTPKFERTTAARLQPETLKIVDPAVAELVGPRFPQGVRHIAEWLHPAAFDLVVPRIDWRLEGRTLRVDATGSNAIEDPLTFRFDPGDGASAVTKDTPAFEHTYARPGAYQARLLLVDARSRIHEERSTVQVNA